MAVPGLASSRSGRWLRRLALVLTLPLGGCASLAPPRPSLPAIVPVSAWGGLAAPAPATAQAVHSLTLHHQGTRWPADGDVPAYLRRLQQWSRHSKGWLDLPYHYVIAPDGRIYAGRSPALPGDSNTAYALDGHLQLMLMGNFEEQQPTPAQLDSAVQLLGHLLRRYQLPPSAIGAHRHRAPDTVCPGAHLYQRFESLRDAAARQAGLGQPAQ